MDQNLKEGLRLYRAGRKDAAAMTYRFALKQDPCCAEAWHMLAVLAYENRALDEAIRLERKALALNPEDARFHHNLAGSLALIGELDEALASYRRAIGIAPAYAEAYYNLSALLQPAADDPAVAAVDKLLAGPRLSQADQVFLHFAAGKFRDDLGAYDRAFRHYRAANAAKQARFSPEETRTQFDAIKAVFERGLISARQARGAGSDLPVFVVGMPRSGTSLVEQILASHPAVHGAGELNELNAMVNSVIRHHPEGTAWPHGVADLSDEVLQAFARQYLRTLSNHATDARRIIDKQPLNFRYLGLVALLFPQARIIHCRRHPLDTCLSCYFQNFTNGQEYSFDQFHLGFFYRLYRELMAHWHAVLPLQVLEVDYEELVSDHEATSRRMVEFLGLDWDPDCLAFHRTRRPVMTGSRWQVRQPLYSGAVDRWRRYERHLGYLKEALGPALP